MRQRDGGLVELRIGHAVVFIDDEFLVTVILHDREQLAQVLLGFLPDPHLEATDLSLFHCEGGAGGRHQRMGVRDAHDRLGRNFRGCGFGGFTHAYLPEK